MEETKGNTEGARERQIKGEKEKENERERQREK